MFQINSQQKDVCLTVRCSDETVSKPVREDVKTKQYKSRRRISEYAILFFENGKKLFIDGCLPDVFYFVTGKRDDGGTHWHLAINALNKRKKKGIENVVRLDIKDKNGELYTFTSNKKETHK